MKTQLSSVLPLEVLDRIGHIDRSTVEPDGVKCFIEESPGRTDKRMSRPILDVAWLFPDEHEGRRPSSPFTEHRLGRPLVEVTTFAVLGRSAQCSDALLPSGQVVLGTHKEAVPGLIPIKALHAPFSTMLLDSSALASGEAPHGRQRGQSGGRRERRSRHGHC